MNITKFFAVLLIAVAPGLAAAAGGGGNYDKANIDPNNQASLQRGAQLYVNYCLGCHALSYQRYGRMGKDLGMTDELVKDHLLFAGDKVGETMRIAMPKRPASKWFGQVPPDLTLIAREKGVDYLYTYLRTFYVDKSKATGMNNVAFPDASMPWVMWEMQGLREPVRDEAGKITSYKQLTKGTHSPEEFDAAMRDLTNFLHYVGEPIKRERHALGVKVIAFLLVLFVLTYFLKKEYWKDIH